MMTRILKKDLKRRKSVNIILFLFITIASIFLSSSINNILVVTSAVGYYMDYAKVPDITFIVMGNSEEGQMKEWLKTEAPGVKSWGYDTLIELNEKEITVKKGGGGSGLDASGAGLYLGTNAVGYCKVYDVDGQDFKLASGEIAVGYKLAEKNKLKKGDHIKISTDGTEKEFTIKLTLKDAAFGSEMVGISRLIITPEDYDEFFRNRAGDMVGLYSANVDDQKEFQAALDDQNFMTAMNVITKETYAMAYSFDMIMAGLLILIGICLIFIALLVLRFTLVFTIEEEYREIGIMKAVGLREFAIKKLYLIKYFFIVTSGALVGLAASIPVSKLMVKSVSQNMIMEDAGANLWVNILCTFLIILLVMLFCYACARKLNKVSAITAIRGGQDGERYSRRAGLKLHRKKRMPVPIFLGLNDIAGHVRRYLVLMITFCLSFILITIPLNTVNTMQSKEMAGKFCVNPDSSVCVEEIEGTGETYKSSEELLQGMDRIQAQLEEIGYQAELTAVPVYFFRYFEKGEKRKKNIMTVQVVGDNTDFLTYKEGDAPKLPNEIAFSEYILEQNNWQIGDTVEAELNGETRSFLITGSYSDYMQIGSSARMNPKQDLGKENMFSYWSIMVDLDTEKTQDELAGELSRKFPDYKWVTSQEVVDRNVGGVQQTLNSMLIPMTALLCAVIMLITLLMERLFIVREKGEIAMMKSVGYRNRTIRLWQVLRMVWVALFSMLAAVPLSFLSNRFMLKPIFAIMGADVEIQVIPWQVYFLYPGVLLAGIIIATVIATINVKKINIRELNNLE